jgi:phage tail sheath protein FI
MAFQISPGVSVTEKDLTLIVPAVATTPAAFVGAFTWGPVEETTLLTSKRDLLAKFGKPAREAEYARYWWTASNFLDYGSNLNTVRVKQTGDLTATSSGTGTALIYNDASYETNKATVGATNAWCARYPGELGNSLKIVVLDYNGVYDATSTDGPGTTDYADYIKNFDDVPNTSVWAQGIGATSAKDELHILVIDAGGLFSGVSGTVLEKFSFLSKASNAQNADGQSNYYVDAVNTNSQYIRWLAHPASGEYGTTGSKVWGTALEINDTSVFKILAPNGGLDSLASYTLDGGAVANISATLDAVEGDCATAFETYFLSGQNIDVSILITGPMSASHAATVIGVAESRKDCVAFVSPNNGGTYSSIADQGLTECLAYRSALNLSSSYGFMDSGYKLQYDSFNDRYIYVPLNADIAGCCVRTDTNQDPWFSPAGYDRGRIKNVVRLAYNPGQTDRDELYKKQINPVVTFPGEGAILFGDKTLLNRPSAFDRINVRRLFIVLEKAIATASRFILFEFNDEFTRNQFEQLVQPFLREVAGRRGITDFRVVCDETNNTPQVIDSNGFVGDIFIKPTRSINFIQLNFVAVPTGLSFAELTGTAS